jgi:hypothetical protein
MKKTINVIYETDADLSEIVLGGSVYEFFSNFMMVIPKNKTLDSPVNLSFVYKNPKGNQVIPFKSPANGSLGKMTGLCDNLAVFEQRISDETISKIYRYNSGPASTPEFIVSTSGSITQIEPVYSFNNMSARYLIVKNTGEVIVADLYLGDKANKFSKINFNINEDSSRPLIDKIIVTSSHNSLIKVRIKGFDYSFDIPSSIEWDEDLYPSKWDYINPKEVEKSVFMTPYTENTIFLTTGGELILNNNVKAVKLGDGALDFNYCNDYKIIAVAYESHIDCYRLDKHLDIKYKASIDCRKEITKTTL